MKNFALFALATLLLVLGFFHFNQENEIIDFSHFTNIIQDQNICIDELEESLYYVSSENTSLKNEISLLKEENVVLGNKILKYEIKIGKLRKRVTNLELDVNAARTRVHILEQERDQTAKPLIVTNEEVEKEPIQKTDDQQMMAEIIEEAKQELKAKTKDLIAAQEILNEKEFTLSASKEELNKKEEAIVSAQKELAKQEKEDAKSVIATLDEVFDPTTEIAMINENAETSDEPKLYIVESVEKKDINLETAIASLTNDEFRSKSPVYNLLENTKINYEYVSCRKDKFGKKIKKLNTKGKNWKFTFLQFNMENPVFSELLEKNFRIKLKNLDNNNYLPITTNRLVAHDVCHDFVYEGEAVQLAFYHEADKDGANYSVEIYLVDEDEEYLLEESIKKIFSNGISTEETNQ